ncbi:MAG: aminotransferase class I/II-fold pyridoxal phosphate-dependent enzyme [Armatimonadota bacterium]|nr:aminotransferase class I/II-fold pyridoxal phosphate-dependent enzyme [Armatimonadota bacterium]MDR7439683.1 aminotransferase class I/II-fold pyridoxal phosphate-dependent enzyme [Armatimonadota bacterium]MDR7562256.1 aminotransferase class I/II-fold pyridoxal phosphate-dependent enzyme [Armatimonadota bacterium]MDR7602743.1 aminotransferase class I/II-fold pyridoxal phosphate-dependent enzyme [Armatimonadota bacterium]
MGRWTSARVRNMPESVFLLMDREKHRVREEGREVVDLSLGSSDLSPPEEVLRVLQEAAFDRTTHRYCLRSDTRPFLEAATRWYARRWGVELDPDREALALVGSQEGLAHLLWAVADPGDSVLLPAVGYPSYWGAVAIAGLEVWPIPLRSDFLPDLASVPEEVARRARLVILNYPNNPTAAVATEAFFEEAVAFARRYDLLLVHDNPYVDIVFEGRTPSPLALPGARERVVELFSLSKSYHMGGFRLGFALGNAEAIAALEAAKAPVDFNQYLGILRMGIVALSLPEERVRRDVEVFRVRRDTLVAALRDSGWPVSPPKATLYVWLRLPEGTDDVAFSVGLLRETGIAVSPGQGFGPGGRGYIRVALVQQPEVLAEAARRLSAFAHARV